MTTTIAAMIRGQLDPLAARLRGSAITTLAQRLATCGAQPGLASLILAVPGVVGELQREHAATIVRLTEIESEVHAASSASEQREVLARIIRREARSARARRGDLRALKRDFDLDALRERISGELAALEAQFELALGFLGRAAAPALASEPLAGSPLRRAGLPGFLVAQLVWTPRFPLRMAAVEALQKLCEALGPADPDRAIARAMVTRVLDAEEHPWVQSAALSVLYLVAPGEAQRLCGEILRAPHAGGGDVQGGVADSLEASRSGMLLEGLDDLASGSFSRDRIHISGIEGAADLSMPDMTSELGAWDSITAGQISKMSRGTGDAPNTPPAAAWVSLIDRITAEASTPTDGMRLVLGPSLLDRITAEATLPTNRARVAKASLFGRAAGPDPTVHEALRREAARERRAVAGEIGETRGAAEARSREELALTPIAEISGAAARIDPSSDGVTAAPATQRPFAASEGVDGALVVLAAVVRESQLEHSSEVDVDLSDAPPLADLEQDVPIAEDTGSWSIADADAETPRPGATDSGAWAAAQAERAPAEPASTWADDQAAAMLSEGTAAVTTVTDPAASMPGATASMSGPASSMSSAADQSLPSAVMEGLRGADAGAPAPVSAALRGRRAFLLRRHAVDLLARRTRDRRAAAQAVDMLAEAIVAGDPSEHVRIGLALAAASLPANELRAVVMLAALADPEREHSPVVRAWALRAAAGSPGADLLLGRSLELDSSALVLRVACVEAANRGGQALASALLQLAARDDRPPAIHEAAAAALEVIERAMDPARAAWTATLASALASTPPGQSTRVPLLRADLPSPGNRVWFGRIFADLTRNDWGVDVDVSPTQLTIRRGDRFRTRLWRTLHELRSPGPNKRQAFSHTRGRVLTGDLRVHSGVLHEVTGTGIPGERTQVEREGGWGRHLPLVDDLIGLPVWQARSVQVVSSLGVCTITWRRGLAGRIAARSRMVARYAWLAELRQQALAASEPAQRGRYAHALRGHFGIELEFSAHPVPHLVSGTGRSQPRRLPEGLRALFPETRVAPPLRLPPPLPPPEVTHVAAAAWLVAPEVIDWAWMHMHYFVSVSANSQQALAYFLALLAAFGLIMAYVKSSQISRARAAVPLVIGGWGTRGKSGTERLKAGLLHGLGYSVFAKTTGCEAMFIHAAPRGPAREIYSFRPYGKATIWEQRELLTLAAKMRTDVFLWECMALSPAYVEILQHSWMRDDLSTITNAYPDHEDIQGPAGMDVAQVISGFVPTRGRLVTSEINFLPVLREAARTRSTTLIAIEDLAGELLPADLLALFPYDEHPRNIALVARLAVELGIDPTLAIVTMAEHVVPDLGVLKRFGPARVRGRVLEFINGCSANERTGFLSNWRRTGCDQLDIAKQPDQYIITVVNNRDDRVSRSQVFARVLVEDVACDRHLLIGTNTHGLLGYIHTSLDAFLVTQRVVTPEDLSNGPEEGLPACRLDALLARLRVVPRTPEALAGQLEIFAHGAGRLLPTAALAEAAERCARWLADDEASALSFAEVYANTRADLGSWTEEALAAAPYTGPMEPPEVDAPATSAIAAAHFARQVARTVIVARLHARLRAALLAGAAAIEEFHDELHATYRELFLELVDVVEDPLTTGDQVVLRCALAVPPGVKVTLMGTQNIKGTGLDFVYRWIALDVAMQDLTALASADAQTRAAALRRLESPDDPGLMDSGLVTARLTARAPEPGELELQTRARTAVAARHEAKRAALGQRKQRGRGERLVAWAEGWVDFLDGARRHGRAKQVMRDLVDQRISHARAAQAMRELDSRAKGGWLVKAMRKR